MQTRKALLLPALFGLSVIILFMIGKPTIGILLCGIVLLGLVIYRIRKK